MHHKNQVPTAACISTIVQQFVTAMKYLTHYKITYVEREFPIFQIFINFDK